MYNRPAECAPSTLSCKPYGLMDRLKDRQLRAKEELARTDKAIKALEENPALAEIFDAVNY